VPEDLSVIGFDDIPQASWGAYRLTTLRQDPVVTADQVIRLIEWRQAHAVGHACHRGTAGAAGNSRPGTRLLRRRAGARPPGKAMTLDGAGHP
jgi:hypothetical protein